MVFGEKPFYASEKPVVFSSGTNMLPLMVLQGHVKPFEGFSEAPFS
jgi:hypothetical protein